ncbi:programmed cell death protein 6-like [Dermacentor albipictus]|uniref:programmed cell death protein 6-like n=1 Tax=Dermacentor albipictus TaxID=60249 RepID=UPI0038FCBBC9
MASKPSAQAPIRDKAFLTSVFESMDRDRTGFINVSELQRALASGTWKPFSEELVLLMVKIFDREFNNKINFDQFCTLWSYITEWVNGFKKVDRTNCGRLDKADLQTVFGNLGYQVSLGLCHMMIRRFDQLGDNKIMLEDFVRMCVILHNAAAEFKIFDPNKTGTAKLTLDDFHRTTFQMCK